MFLPVDSRWCNHLDAFRELTFERRLPNVRLTKRESIYSIDYPLVDGGAFRKVTIWTTQKLQLAKGVAESHLSLFLGLGSRLEAVVHGGYV